MPESPDEMALAEPTIDDQSVEPERRKSLRDRANEPSDTVGMGSSVAISCSVMALLLTLVLIAGLLISRWLF